MIDVDSLLPVINRARNAIRIFIRFKLFDGITEVMDNIFERRRKLFTHADIDQQFCGQIPYLLAVIPVALLPVPERTPYDSFLFPAACEMNLTLFQVAMTSHRHG